MPLDPFVKGWAAEGFMWFGHVFPGFQVNNLATVALKLAGVLYNAAPGITKVERCLLLEYICYVLVTACDIILQNQPVD